MAPQAMATAATAPMAIPAIAPPERPFFEGADVAEEEETGVVVALEDGLGVDEEEGDAALMAKSFESPGSAQPPVGSVLLASPVGLEIRLAYMHL